MKIAVLGGGAMGSLFGSYLSLKNDVTIIDLNTQIVDAINKDGIIVHEKNGDILKFYPKATTKADKLGQMDLVIVFVKAMFTSSALENNKAIIGKDTYLMTLQNGAGHEAKLKSFANESHIIIGSTQHNSSIIKPGEINHGGIGHSSIGLLSGKTDEIEHIANIFTQCNLECAVSDNIQKQIWNKLFTNTAASSLTAILQSPLGFIVENDNAHSLMKALVHEAVNVANSLGLDFIESNILSDVENVCKNAKNGYTSIYADIRDGRKTEVDTISGSVICAAEEKGIDVPYHRFVVNIIHAMEGKQHERL